MHPTSGSYLLPGMRHHGLRLGGPRALLRRRRDARDLRWGDRVGTHPWHGEQGGMVKVPPSRATACCLSRLGFLQLYLLEYLHLQFTAYNLLRITYNLQQARASSFLLRTQTRGSRQTWPRRQTRSTPSGCRRRSKRSTRAKAHTVPAGTDRSLLPGGASSQLGASSQNRVCDSL